MLTSDEAHAKMDAGEHVVELIFTWLDGAYESFFPSHEGGWTSSMFDSNMTSDFVVIKGKNRGHRIEIPLVNVRYFEVIVHNDPLADHVCGPECDTTEVSPIEGEFAVFRMDARGNLVPVQSTTQGSTHGHGPYL